MSLHKILKYLAYALGIIGAIFALMIMTGSEAMIDNMLYVAYTIFGIVIVLVLIYVVLGLFQGNIKKTLLSVGLFLTIVLIAYFMSSGTDLNLEPFRLKGSDVTEAISRNVGTGLYTFYALAFVAIASMVLFGIKKMIK